jgi:hypothetical protein
VPSRNNCEKLLHFRQLIKVRSEVMSSGQRKKEPPPIDNSVSDSTGQYDLRFVLWRQFCAQHNIPVDTLPSQLENEQKDLWEAMKSRRLR